MDKTKMHRIEGDELVSFLKILEDVITTDEVCTRIPRRYDYLENKYVKVNHGIDFPIGSDDKLPIPVVMNLGYPIENLIGLVLDKESFVCNNNWFEVIEAKDLLDLIRYSSLIIKGVEF
ncbi:MAG: hypothetical protein ACRCXX_04105 [Cetobacterium sp.]|uniref:hypothetical protein n=1 Tax=Cetobacterium sp. TaxID=2071632 RepID=UPI003F2D41E3